MKLSLCSRLRWWLKIGWKLEKSVPWLHSFSHLYRNTRTGKVRWHHDPC